jgi:hypothetical protein
MEIGSSPPSRSIITKAGAHWATLPYIIQIIEESLIFDTTINWRLDDDDVGLTAAPNLVFTISFNPQLLFDRPYESEPLLS